MAAEEVHGPFCGVLRCGWTVVLAVRAGEVIRASAADGAEVDCGHAVALTPTPGLRLIFSALAMLELCTRLLNVSGGAGDFGAVFVRPNALPIVLGWFFQINGLMLFFRLGKCFSGGRVGGHASERCRDKAVSSGLPRSALASTMCL